MTNYEGREAGFQTVFANGVFGLGIDKDGCLGAWRFSKPAADDEKKPGTGYNYSLPSTLLSITILTLSLQQSKSLQDSNSLQQSNSLQSSQSIFIVPPFMLLLPAQTSKPSSNQVV